MDVRKVGFFISDLRRKKDYTQAELAEMMGVSHQAVSKWERGESLPDIGLLPELASTLGVTVDELLRGSIASTHTVHKEFSNQQNDAAQKELSNQQNDVGGANEFAKPSAPPTYDFEQARVAEFEIDVPAQENPIQNDLVSGKINLQQISELAPFLPREVMETMVEQADGEVNWELLGSIAPFVGRETFERLVDRAIDGTVDADHIAQLAPFLGQGLLNKMVEHLDYGTITWNVVEKLAPFLNRSMLTGMFERVLDSSSDTPDLSKLASLAPFVNKEDLVRLVERIGFTQLPPSLLSSLAPFLPSDVLGRWVLQYK